mmetsp:Transcript_22389/g.63927  ORF Transcript_22389/g.63927 Transcript_22389/m.63927 type:complete len:204 (+) Transcript_22389:179-790(+)
MGWFFETPAQISYISGQFPGKLLAALQTEDDSKKFMYFLAHRELLYAVLKFFDYPIALTGVRKGYLPTASTIVWELHKDEGDTEPHIKTFIWWPTQERGEKERSTGKDNPLLMQTGHDVEATPNACKDMTKCHLSTILEVFKSRLAKTGSYKELCAPHAAVNELVEKPSPIDLWLQPREVSHKLFIDEDYALHKQAAEQIIYN